MVMRAYFKEWRKQRGLSQEQVTHRIGMSTPNLSRLERGLVSYNQKTLEALAQEFDTPPANLLYPPDALPGEKPEKLRAQNSQPLQVSIPEIDIRAGMGGGGEAVVAWQPDGDGGMMEIDAVRDYWSISRDYLRSELHVDARDARIIEVQGDSMEPTLRSGDRVMVNMADCRPTPPGIFALWDGFGVVVKRVEFVLNSDPPNVRITSDNQQHGTYERTLEEVSIIGRIVWRASRV